MGGTCPKLLFFLRNLVLFFCPSLFIEELLSQFCFHTSSKSGSQAYLWCRTPVWPWQVTLMRLCWCSPNSENKTTKALQCGWDVHISHGKFNHFALQFPYLKEMKLITFYLSQYFSEARNCCDWHTILAKVSWFIFKGNLGW